MLRSRSRSPPRSYASPPQPISVSTDAAIDANNEQRLAQLEKTLSSGMQQMNAATSSIQTMVSSMQKSPQPFNPINITTPTSFNLNPEITSAWSSAAGNNWSDDPSMHDPNVTHIEYETDVKDAGHDSEFTQ